MDVNETKQEIAKEDVVGKWKEKKFVRRRKSKKEKEDPLVREIRLTVESGKVEFGCRKGIKNALLGKAKLFVLARNTPSDIKDDVERYAKLSNIPVLVFNGTTMELGSVCGKPFPISVLSIYDEGNSDILKMAKQ
jgi:large subunit ribosomal protein L30e